MEDLVIAGAGGLGREILYAVHAINAVRPRWHIVGFLDDRLAGSDETIDGTPVLGALTEISDYDSAKIVMAIGNANNLSIRSQRVAELQLAETRYATIIHPMVNIPPESAVGIGTVILAGVVFSAPVSVGAHVVIMPNTVLTHDDVIEDYVTMASGVLLAGQVTVHRGAYIGAGARVRERCSIGEWSLVGMGSVVLQDIPAHEVWAGVPAKRLRDATVQ